MKIMIFGSSGMLGHKLVEILSKNHQLLAVSRKPININRKNIVNLQINDLTNKGKVQSMIFQNKPDVIINAVGIVKNNPQIINKEIVLKINSDFPHMIKDICSNLKIRMIHISTDCVFSGKIGNYSENNSPDPIDLYGESKLNGEVEGKNILTIRTSIIGFEDNTSRGLIEWLLSQKGKTIKGYKNAIFSGLSTEHLSIVIKNIIKNHKSLEGIYHVSSNPINKYDLLIKLNNLFDLGCEIIPTDKPVINRSLDSARFWNKIQCTPPSWDKMTKDLLIEYNLEGKNVQR